MEVSGWNAFLPVCGIAIGASLQYVFTKHIENHKHQRDLRSKAYMDYLKSVCEHAQLRYSPDPSKELQELFTRTADAKSRICLYGSKEAIQAFSQFERLGATMNTSEQREAFTNMVAIMRSDSGGEDCRQVEDLQTVLLGSDRTRNRA